MTAIESPRVLITAGASGIGRVIAHAFAAHGAKIWVTDVDEQALAECPALGTANAWMSPIPWP